MIPRLHDHSNQGEAVIPRLRFSRPESLNLWSSGPEAPTFLGPRAWAQGEGPRAQGLFFLITLLVGVNCSVLDFCCTVGCKTSKFDGLISVTLKIYSYGHVGRKPQWSQDPGPRLGAQGKVPGPFFKITLLFGANCSVLDFCCIVGCKTSGFDGLVVLKIYSYGHVDRKPQWSRTQGLDPGPKGGSQGPGPFFLL